MEREREESNGVIAKRAGREKRVVEREEREVSNGVIEKRVMEREEGESGEG